MNLIPLPANFEVLRASEAYLQTIKKSNIIINYHNSIKMPMMPLDTLKQHWPECDLEHYLVQIKKNYDFLEPLPGLLPIPLTAIFMPHYVQENRQPRTSTKTLWEKLPQAKKIPEPLETELKRFQVKSESIFAVLAKPNQNKLVLLGAPALGKSTLAHYLLITLLEAGSLEDSPLEEWLKAFSGYLPVLIELEHYFTDIQAKQYSDFLEYFYHCSSMCPHSLELFKEHFRQHPSFVIFDGLDKVSEPILRQEITQEIIDFAYEYPQAYIIVTSRSWGYQGREFQASNFKEYIIQPFKLEQIKSFTHRWLHQLYPYETHKIDQICNQLNTLLQSAPALQQLASQPWLLTLVLSLAQQQPLSTKRGQLCQQLIHLMCQHSSLNLPQTEIAAETLQLELLSHLAQQLQNTPEGLTHNYLSTSALTTALSEFFQRYFVATQADEISQAFINQLAANHFIFCGFGDQHYGFIHRLFLEYFCAVNIVTQFESGLSLETLKQSFFQAHYQETTWHEILKFICALVAAPVAGQLIDTLIPSPQDIYGQTAEFILAIQCLAEVSDLKAVAATAETVLARICYWFEETEKNTAESIHEQELSFAIHALPAIEAIGTQWPRRE
ncbi:MAG: hypothetical protein SVR94_17900, partial [Pseudomonadota bacterium]|nr:hypothetical protein [Pseudomonadota bacterium]